MQDLQFLKRILKKSMVEVSLEEFEKNFDMYMDRIETNKEEFLVRKADGTAVVAMPAEQLDQAVSQMSDEEWYNLYNDHEEAS
jgi:hypothetical protein